MISVIRQRKLLPMLVMLFALAGLSLSVVSESFSHVTVGPTGEWESVSDNSHMSHEHHHDFGEAVDEPIQHHDAGNHTHETVDHLKVPIVFQRPIKLRQPFPFAGGSPRTIRYRLERPPKDVLYS